MKSFIYILSFLFCLFCFGQKNNFDLGKVQGNPIDIEKVCYSDGVDTLQGYKIHTYDIVEEYGFVIVDQNGDEVVGANEVDSRYCNDSESCVKSQTLYSLVDNTGTSFTNENTLRVYFTDGTVYDIVQTPQTGWTAQLQAWDDLITDLMTQKCSAGFTVETRFNPPPFTSTNLSNYTPPDGLLVPASELWGKIEPMKYRYLNVGACSTCPAINQMDLVAVNGVELASPVPMTFMFEVGQTFYYDLCKTCGQEGTLYYQNTSTVVPEADKPLCLFSCAEQFPPIPESGCNFTIRDDLCDLGVVDINGNFKPVTVRYTDCGDGAVLTDVFEVDPNDATLVPYTPIGGIGDCETGTIVDPPEPTILLEDIEKKEICIINDDGTFSIGWQVTNINTQGDRITTYEDQTGTITEPNNWSVGACPCGSYTSLCLCYGDGSSDSDYAYSLNSGDPTEGSFSNNSNTIKWETSGTLTASIAYIDDCLIDGGEATMNITDQDGNVSVFTATGFQQPIGTTPSTSYEGVASGSFSGKIRAVTISCSTNNNGLGRACQWVSCDKQEVRWYDGTKQLTDQEIRNLKDCIIEDCESDIIQIEGCASESNAEVNTGDLILTVAEQDCNNVILSSTQYNITQGNAELSEPINTEDCTPQPDVTQTEECIVDTEKREWTEITIVQGVSISVIYVNQETLQIGTPSGTPSEWEACDRGVTYTGSESILCYDSTGDGEYDMPSIFRIGSDGVWEYLDRLGNVLNGSDLGTCNCK